MADYHPLIARAVASLDKNSGENRRALYERARTALVAQLRGVVPPLDESEITRERLALEEAIRKVEAESARHARETARPAFIKRATEATRREEVRRDDARREQPPRDEPQREETRREETLAKKRARRLLRHLAAVRPSQVARGTRFGSRERRTGSVRAFTHRRSGGGAANQRPPVTGGRSHERLPRGCGRSGRRDATGSPGLPPAARVCRRRRHCRQWRQLCPSIRCMNSASLSRRCNRRPVDTAG